MKEDNRLCVHHIGGRDGYRAFPLFPRFERDVITVVYDADADCIEQVRQLNQQAGSCYVFPYCIGGKSGIQTFNINYDPYTSSLYDANPNFTEYYYFQTDHDYVFSDVTRPMERRLVSTVTLDDLYAEVNPTIPPPPDLLSLDTQGSEFDILNGGIRTLDASVVALKLEVEFRQLYSEQKLFGDLCSLLARSGFDFVCFTDLHRMSPHRLPLGMRADEFMISGDALFFRRLDNIARSFEGQTRDIKFKKLAFIAMVLGLFEFGVSCLDKVTTKESTDIEPDSDCSFDHFFRELRGAMSSMPQVLPGTFSARYTWDESRLRFASEAEQQKPRPTNNCCRDILHFHLADIQKALLGESTPLERVLASWGLEQLAMNIRNKRTTQLTNLSKFFRQ